MIENPILSNSYDIPLVITDEIFQFILNQFFTGNKTEIQNWINKFKEINFKFGTKEWADGNFNTHYACTHGCRYCYAWCEAYQRKRPYWENWGKKMVKRDYWNKNWQKRNDGYTIMYPTTHDILPEIIDDSFQAIKNMLDANINVLLVSKPHIEVITKLIDEFSDFKVGQPKITLRFSISTNDDKLIRYWESAAPRFSERLECLKLAFDNGFSTSVSMEPFLPAKSKSKKKEIESLITLINSLLPFVKETLWLGMMNHIPKKTLLGKHLNSTDLMVIQDLLNFYDFENIYKLISFFYQFKKIRWKESIKKKFINKIKREV